MLSSNGFGSLGPSDFYFYLNNLWLDEPPHHQDTLVCPLSRWKREHSGGLNPGMVKEGCSLWTVIMFPDIYQQTGIREKDIVSGLWTLFVSLLCICHPDHLPSCQPSQGETFLKSSRSAHIKTLFLPHLPRLRLIMTSNCKSQASNIVHAQHGCVVILLYLLISLPITVGGLISHGHLMMFAH